MAKTKHKPTRRIPIGTKVKIRNGSPSNAGCEGTITDFFFSVHQIHLTESDKYVWFGERWIEIIEESSVCTS